MVDSKVYSMKLTNREGHGFLIREFLVPVPVPVPIRVCSMNEAKFVKNYDMPVLVVFVCEDHDHKGDMGIVVERDSCNSSGSAFAASSIIKDVNVIKTYDFRDGNSIEHPTKKMTSEALGEKLIDLEAQPLMLAYHELKVLIENLERRGAEVIADSGK
ncbi:hypothetical protein PIB30_075679 [Stylosanthes scabra]|uniref:BFN domain-containing protein n=1 Tax=Stylosanthes scabra TaxID=79078 RepID=A0ABU6ZNY6_9FABA|nr:hypothetical protein [Stylosanthes scabra]